MDFKQDFSAPYGNAQKLSNRITRVLCENPSPYTYTGTGTYIVSDGKTAAVIDPGPMDIKHGEALLKVIGRTPVSHILVTHTHLDHSALSKWLSDKTGAQLYAYGPHGAGRTGGLAHETVEAGADTDFQPDYLLKDGDSICGDDWHITAHHTPGHTSNHMCFMLEEEKALFVGDHIMGWATTVISPPDGDVRAYLESLRKVADLSPVKLIPAHGPTIEEKAERFIRAIITHRKMREGQIISLLEEKDQTIKALVERMYKDTDPRLHGAAARSVLGHLIALIDDKRVTVTGEIGLSGKYKLCKKV